MYVYIHIHIYIYTYIYVFTGSWAELQGPLELHVACWTLGQLHLSAVLISPKFSPEESALRPAELQSLPGEMLGFCELLRVGLLASLCS